ncbi:uncharacterized protein LOC127797289 [Diospyros lotus]|uniref:uncharacterized protein LOC127797289 n=1 Tax=Diospyros lotus TaxID=55363 RepID=UPI00225394B4|nr:uncharacterized protein LOC127797289 [Diospyros lotus]
MSQHPPPIPSNLHKKPTTALPDFILTALSLFLLASSSKPSAHLIPFPLNPRRFLRISTMSRRSPNPNLLFATPQSLADWLKPRLPSDSFAAWGIKPGTKNVHNLWLELSEGETSLADSKPPVRNVEVVIVRVIGSGDKVLIESHQELSDGAVRSRCRPLSEKMRPGETVEAAVVRAVREELGSIIGASLNNSAYDGIVKIVPNSYRKKVEERVSVSYPGLPACYVLHSVDARVDGLPDGEFSTEEEAEYENSDQNKVADSAVSCIKHYWKWVDADSL